MASRIKRLRNFLASGGPAGWPVGLMERPDDRHAGPDLIGRLVSFGLVGTLCAGISYVAFIVALKLGTHYLLANILSWAAGVAVGFVLNRTVTFRITERTHWSRHLALFLTGSLAQLGLSSVGLALLVGRLGLPPRWAWVLNTGVLAVAMFLWLNFVAFRRRYSGR